jgi:hypothetical protein
MERRTARRGKENHMVAHAGRVFTLMLIPVTACTTTGRNPLSAPRTEAASIQDEVIPGRWEQVSALEPDAPLVVTTNDGRRLEGVFNVLDSATLVLTAAGGTPVVVARSDIARITAPATNDGLTNGILIGAGTGLGLAISILSALGAQDGYVLPSAKVGAPLLLTGVGGLVGMLIDRGHRKPGRLLYLARRPMQDSRQ